MNPSQPLTPHERIALDRAVLAAQVLHQAYPEMPVQMQMTLFTVTLNPGIYQADVGRILGIGRSALSRHVERLGSLEETPTRKAGLGLIVAVADPMDRRKETLTLTHKGAAVLAQYIQAIKPQ